MSPTLHFQISGPWKWKKCVVGFSSCQIKLTDTSIKIREEKQCWFRCYISIKSTVLVLCLRLWYPLRITSKVLPAHNLWKIHTQKPPKKRKWYNIYWPLHGWDFLKSKALPEYVMYPHYLKQLATVVCLQIWQRWKYGSFY